MNWSLPVSTGSLSSNIGFRSNVVLLSFYFLLLFIVQTIGLQGTPQKIFKTIAKKCIHITEPIPPSYDPSIWYTFTDVAIILLLFVCVWKKRHAIKALFWEGSAKFLWIFLLCMLLSIFTSSVPHFGMPYVRLFQFSLLALLFCLIANGFPLLQYRSFLLWMCSSILLLALFECSLGIYQCFALTTPEEMQSVAWNPSTLSGMASYGPFDFFSTTPRISLLRAYGTFYHPNVFGGFLVFSLLVSYYLFYSLQRLLAKITVALGIAIELLGLICTFSRSAFLALVFATPLWLILCWRSGSTVQRKHLIHFCIFLLSTVLLFSILFAKPLLRRGPLFNVPKILATEGERLKFQRTAMNMVQSSPLTGVGYNHYLILQPKYSPTPLSPSEHLPVHNIYLLIAAETGLLGLFAFCTFLGALFKSANVHKISASGATFFSSMVGLLFIGCCDCYPLGTMRQGQLLFFIIASFLALEGRNQREPTV